MPPNPFLLAADNDPSLLPLLRSNPALAPAQDEHGYSLLHAAASYNHIDLIRKLVQEFHCPVDVRDEDGETPLFVVETVEAARVLVEELRLDPQIRNSEESQTAREKIEAEGEFPEVALYLADLERQRSGTSSAGNTGNSDTDGVSSETGATDKLPPLPDGLDVTISTMEEPASDLSEVDPEFRRRIEQLAVREDFYTDAGQAELKQLVRDAVMENQLGEERNVRPRQD